MNFFIIVGVFYYVYILLNLALIIIHFFITSTAIECSKCREAADPQHEVLSFC